MVYPKTDKPATNNAIKLDRELQAAMAGLQRQVAAVHSKNFDFLEYDIPLMDGWPCDDERNPIGICAYHPSSQQHMNAVCVFCGDRYIRG